MSRHNPLQMAHHKTSADHAAARNQHEEREHDCVELAEVAVVDPVENVVAERFALRTN